MSSLAPRFFAAIALAAALCVGCGSTTNGCLKALPTDPKPFGFPPDQIIEGGIQARITKPGIDKLLSSVTGQLTQLQNGFCASDDQKLFDFLGQKVFVCNQPTAPNTCPGSTGCAAYVYLDSKNRPASHVTGDVMPPVAANNQDGKLKIVITTNNSPAAPRPQVTVDAFLDVLVPAKLSATGLISGSCYLYAYTPHVDDNNADPMHIQAVFGLEIDPATGKLGLKLDAFDIPNLALTTDGVGGVCDFISTITSAVLNFLNGLPAFIRQFIINLLKPTIDSLVQNLLPADLGIKGVFDSGSLLRSFNPPKDTNLEVHVIAGGYVHTKDNGLILGVMSGLNSDRDQTSRGPGLASEPSLCVPVRPTPALGTAPWNLPPNTARGTFTLSPAGPFSGNPEPVNALGALQDVAIGVSRTFLDLAGFHLINSGTLCLAIGGDAIPQLNAGTLSVIVGSLGNILDNKKAPLSLVLRPQQPITFTIGSGTMMDPLLNIGIADMRVDFYAFIEERFVRLLTMSLDMNAGLNLMVTKGADGKPALQPTLLGIDAKNVTIRISNTDLLQEKPKDLEAVFPTLINIATGALGGVIKPIALPSLAGFSLDDLTIGRVQTTQDDFLGIFATIKTGTPSALIDWSDPAHPKLVGPLRTRAAVDSVVVPRPEQLRALFAELLSPMVVKGAARPTVTLRLEADGNYAQEVEYQWRINGGMWRPWSKDAHPVLADDAFLLQGRHVIEVRARVVNQWSTEDETPERLEVLIDSMAPEIHPKRDPEKVSRLLLGGSDIVSDDAALQYAWLDRSGQQTKWTSDDFMSVEQARALTDDGANLLTIFAKDEAGNIGQTAVDLSTLLGFHGRTTAPAPSGCGCELGAANTGSGTGGALAFVLGLLVLLWRRPRAGALVAVLAAVGLYASGCGCDKNAAQCSIDDDCARMQCAQGQIPQCQANMCICNPDLPPGETGSYASMALRGPDAYIAAYNKSYGDLMIGHITPPGVVTNWDFVDGVPDEQPSVPLSHVRGGIESKGDDVGRYTSIQITPENDPVIAYYDKTHGTLRFAHFGVIRWRSHTVDKGVGSPEGGGDDVGRWASMSIGKDGKPAIAYTAIAQSGTMSGKPEGQLRFAQAKVVNPTSTSDWTVSILDARPLPDPNDPTGSKGDMGAAVPDGGTTKPADPLYPEVIALMPQLQRKSDGNPGIAYYDRPRGNLRYIEYLPSTGKWSTPLILDGEDAMGKDTADVGMFPSLTYDDKDVAHISYVDSTRDNLLYVNSSTKTPEVADDGYRPMDEMTLDGIPSPVFHLVGDSSSIQVVNDQVVIAYQDSTTVQLRLAQRAAIDGKWTLATVAGHASPFKGSYGFYANLRVSSKRGIISTYAINQQLDNPLYFVEVFSIDLGFIM